MPKRYKAFFLSFFFASIVYAKEMLNLKGKAGEFSINPATLAISALPEGSSLKIDLTQSEYPFDQVKGLVESTKEVQWDYPHLGIHVRVSVDDSGLTFSFRSRKEQSFQWPVAGLSLQAKALVIPSGEGLYLPCHDTFWIKVFQKYADVSLSMPFWAIEYPSRYVSYILADQDEDTAVQVRQERGQLYLANTHRFLKREHFLSYEVSIHITEGFPISPALDYRSLLIEKNRFVSLKRKILENADVGKLLGAFHIWAWGDGVSLAMLDQLDQLGIKHCWLGYDATPNSDGFNVDETYVHMAKNRGYLIGPYDSFNNAQNPKTADSITSIWPHQLWPQACIRHADGSILKGVAYRGCYLSPEALRLRESREKNIAHHIDAMVSKGDNSLFLEGDASEPLFDDYSTQHPMTRLQDLKDRLERMRYISSTKKLVLGSETGLAWANDVIAYNNGSFLIFPEAFWSYLGDKQRFCGGWSTEALKGFLKPYHAPSEFIQAFYDPRYRIPLYQAVFHDSVISTDRWELNELKIPAIRRTKDLLQNLYNIPPIWVLDKKTLEKNKDYFSAYYRFFSPLHQMAGLEPLIRFEWLTANRLVQQAQYGNRLILTANFSNQAYQRIGAHCIQAEWIEDGSKTLFCPRK